MRYAILALIFAFFFAPSKSTATCNCAEYNYVTMYCLELGCSGHRSVLDCAGIYHDSCFACVGEVNPLPCCPNAPVYGAQIGGICDIDTARGLAPAALYVTAFATSCNGTLVRAVIGLPKAAMER
jgi:hypothetical protein